MILGLVIVLALILTLPFIFKTIEHNLEYFLFVMGIAAAIISGILSWNLIMEILTNYLLYMITAAVLVAGLLFRVSAHKIRELVGTLLQRVSLRVFIFCLIVGLGLISSLITAIIAALILVEIVHAMPLKHQNKISLIVITCFSIGLGAALTPIGEPLSTIVVSKLNADFFYLLKEVGIYIFPGIIVFGIFGAFYIERKHTGEKVFTGIEEQNMLKEEDNQLTKKEGLDVVFIRTFKIFIFVMALELLGSGFKPLINNYIVRLDSMILYWINMVSAILDNATLAAAEISPVMSSKQIQAILMGIIVSGGMLIPGNIPNIISAGKLKIKSREWARIGVPIGLVVMIIYFLIIFIL